MTPDAVTPDAVTPDAVTSQPGTQDPFVGESAVPGFHGIVAIDGPSGSGKSTVSREVAVRLGFAYLDTGAMYRAVCWAAMSRGVVLDDHAAVATFARGLEIFVSTDPHHEMVAAGGIDVTEAIRESIVSEAVSEIATNSHVRVELAERQRAMIKKGDVVLEGRDTTTVVAPHAEVRILITASAEARLSRRTAELHVVVDDQALAATRRQIFDRDDRDSTVVEFRTAADGVITIDTSELDLEQSVQAVLAVVTATMDEAAAPE